MAQRSPEALKRLFVSQDFEARKFTFRFIIGGVPTEVSVDDYIPVKFADEKPYRDGDKWFKIKMQIAYASEVLWVVLLEKAWAKLHKSYERTESGDGINTIKDFVGCEGESVKIEEDNLDTEKRTGLIK